MLILDEQLLGRGLEAALRRWYRGRVVYITDLRPHSIIKDDAIPLLLRGLRQPTFITINETDFWRRAPITTHFCVICFPLPDSRVPEITGLLRAAFRQPAFATRARRMGKVPRVTPEQISYYTHRNRTVQAIQL